jgi:ATP-dependent Clp protease ATP-binding subunit ClpC
LFEFGRLKDAQGRIAGGEDTLFILTSNAVALPSAKRALGFGTPGDRAPDVDTIRKALSTVFRHEFLNRIDQVVAFDPLEDASAREIARIKLSELQTRVAGRGLSITFEESAIDLLVKEGFSPEYGARDLDRAIDRLVNRPLSALIVRGAHGSYIGSATGDQIVFAPPAPVG